MPYALKGRNVLVTGGSRGLGALVAAKFAAEGCHLAINYVANAARAEQTAQKIGREFGGKVAVVQGGEQFGEERIKQVKEKAVLKQETLLDDCADAFIMAAKNTSMTGQNIQIDSGLAIK
ncbi:hypothetical protein MMC18_002113 [Xylographa bjoerkii]|nr:hypothetical protein [Xylographa bjoerkii]